MGKSRQNHQTLSCRPASFNHRPYLLSSSTLLLPLNMTPSAVYPETEVAPPANSVLFLKENAKALLHGNALIAGTVPATATEPKPSSSDEIHEEYQYLNLIRRILAEGEHLPDRTGTGTLSLFAPPPKKNNCASPSRKPIQILLQIQTLVYLFCRFSRQSVCSYAP